MPAAHKPTKNTRAAVKNLAAAGLIQDDIAMMLGMSPNTLRKYYPVELAIATNEVTAMAVNQVIQGIQQGIPAYVFFWLKCRAKWREKHDDIETPEAIGNITIVDLNEDYVEALENEEEEAEDEE